MLTMQKMLKKIRKNTGLVSGWYFFCSKSEKYTQKSVFPIIFCIIYIRKNLMIFLILKMDIKELTCSATIRYSEKLIL